MGRSVSYATGAQVVTFAHLEPVETLCPSCDGSGAVDAADEHGDEGEQDCAACDGSGEVLREQDEHDWDCLIEDFRSHLKELFPSVEDADRWIDREDHVLAENRLASFGISEYCGLVSYWIVPKESGYYSDDQIEPLAKRWIASIEDKFVAAFGELTKVGSMSNGEGVYRRISNS